MKQILTSSLLLFAIASQAQQLNASEWEKESKTNIRLLPKYGNKPKTAEQKYADAEYIQTIMQQEKFHGDHREASNHMIALGFNYLYRGEIKTAMNRFNQAYLLDNLNSDIYWGFGAVYMALGDYEKAKQQYDEGLREKPDNTHLLTDLGTYYMAQYFPMLNMPANKLVKDPPKEARQLLDSALVYLNKSYLLNVKDPNTTYKLSTTYYFKGDCDIAWKYHDKCMALGGQPITAEYTKELEKTCGRKK